MFIKSTAVNYLIVIVALVFLVFWLNLGWQSALKLQQARVVVRNAKAVVEGLRFFYNDYDRFPRADEFQNGVSLVPYFSVFPPREFVSRRCPASFMYSRPALNNFVLNFCLPAAAEQYRAGWNKLGVN